MLLEIVYERVMHFQVLFTVNVRSVFYVNNKDASYRPTLPLVWQESGCGNRMFGHLKNHTIFYVAHNATMLASTACI